MIEDLCGKKVESPIIQWAKIKKKCNLGIPRTRATTIPHSGISAKMRPFTDRFQLVSKPKKPIWGFILLRKSIRKTSHKK